jgi:tol-pal system protein YbgF
MARDTPASALRWLAWVPLVALAAGCSSSSQLESIERQLVELQRQVLQLQRQTPTKEEIAELQQQAGTQARGLQRAQADIQQELHAVTVQIQQLEGRLEDTTHRLAQLSQQIAVTNQELKAFRAAPGVDVPRLGSGGPASGELADPTALYQTAYNDYLRGNFDLAILGFRQYLESFPGGDLADSAAYWIGESYYRQGKYAEAIRQLDAVLDQYPQSSRTPSALLRKGYAYLELGEQAKGVVHLQHVMRRFPGSDEASLARQQLVGLGIDPQNVGG